MRYLAFGVVLVFVGYHMTNIVLAWGLYRFGGGRYSRPEHAVQIWHSTAAAVWTIVLMSFLQMSRVPG